jgi:AbiV family abortive infection protein
MESEVQEWLHQAEYDYEDAEYLFQGKRYPKAVFCCHLALEKALKALYLHYNQEKPPRTQALIFLSRQCRMEFQKDLKILWISWKM